MKTKSQYKPIEATSGLSKVVHRNKPRKPLEHKLTKPEGHSNKNKRGRSDVEIDRRVFNGHTVVLLEDSSMMKPDGTSYQYIIAIESNSKAGKLSLVEKHYITDLFKRDGYSNAYSGARAVFSNPESFKGFLGDNWLGYENK